MVAEPALRRAASHVVLHAETCKHLYLPVVQFHRDRHFQHTLWRAQNLPQARIELQVFRRHVELDLRDAKRIQIFARRHPRNDRLGNRFYHRGHGCFLSLSDATMRLPPAGTIADTASGIRPNKSAQPGPLAPKEMRSEENT